MTGRVRDRIDEAALRKEIGLGETEIDNRKKFLEFGDADVKRLRGLEGTAKKYADSVIDRFYGHLLSFDEARKFFDNPETLKYVKEKQKEYFEQLTQGVYGEKYVESRLVVAAVHEAIDLPNKLYVGMYSYYLREIMMHIFKSFPDNPDLALSNVLSIIKIIFFDLSIVGDTYNHKRETTIKKQMEAIRELSTPVLQLREGLLMLPIIGVVDSDRARRLTAQLLHSIRDNRAHVVVMDITGVPMVDTKVANHLMQTVEAARLMGATIVITGLSAEVAQTMVSLGVDLGRVKTVGDLQEGIAEADRLLGYEVVKRSERKFENTQK